MRSGYLLASSIIFSPIQPFILVKDADQGTLAANAPVYLSIYLVMTFGAFFALFMIPIS